MIRLILSFGLGLALLGAAAPGFADVAPAAPAAPAGNPKQRAEELLTKGRALMAEPGKLDEACTTLEQSQALENRGDTLLNLAECHRRQGRTASAWKEFGQAIELAQEANFGPAIQVAKQRHKDLEAKLSFLTIVVPPETAALRGFAVTLNGYPVPREAWGKPVPVDGGSFAVAATAEGQQPFSATSQVGAESDKREVTVTLVPVPPPPVAAPAPPPAPPAPPLSNTNAYVAIGIAGVGAVLAVGFGVAALEEKGSSANGAFERSGTYGTVAIVSIVAAAIGGVTGGIELAHNRKQAAAARTATAHPWVVPLLGPKVGGAAVGLSF